MSSFLNCQHCSHQIHVSAPACPKCGAPSIKAPSPTVAVNNTVVWILAFAPLIGLILESLVAGVLAQNEYEAAHAMATCSDLHLKRGPASIQADSRPGITATDSPFKPALAANEPAFSRADRHFIRAN
ncbi:hypothetical protein [Herminiimonas contaminans]|uniref:hypothetical protein n=1 Tax=Herminiimonas contaminans TaxID=1111140 RepID=UPI001E34F10D|nr:hypothetical protein [Herminiimonas contaminans]